MAGYCETFDHTADVGLRAHADSLAELLAALAQCLAGIICPAGGVRPAQNRSCHIEAEDVEALTVDFLWEVMSTIQFDHFVLARVEIHHANNKTVNATLVGEPYDPSRHEIITEVKAVTYHQLKVTQENDKWSAKVIVDL